MLKTTTTTTDDIQTLSELARALSSPQRLEILNALNDNSLSISELSKLLQQPMSTATTNVDILEQVGLITTKMQYTKKGKVRLCSRSCDAIYIGVHRNTVQELNQLNIDLPIGSYVGYNIVPSCGLATKTHTIGKDDDPDNFSARTFRGKVDLVYKRICGISNQQGEYSRTDERTRNKL